MKFKVGDRVVIQTTTAWGEFANGKVGTVLKIVGDDTSEWAFSYSVLVDDVRRKFNFASRELELSILDELAKVVS